MPAKKSRRVGPTALVFSVVTALAYATSIIWPWAVGARTGMWVDVIVFPFIALIAYSVVLGDRTPDDSTVFWGGV
ncbi:hypothetical protein ACWD6R_28695 [Streptomyces sp. NPDC005151]